MSGLTRLVLGFSIFLPLTVLFAENVPLAEARKRLKLPDYTTSQKKLIVDQASFFLSNLYVHRDLKIADFGEKADPVPRLEALSEKASKLDDETLHAKLAEIFADLHDLHTSYVNPVPRSCGVAFIPVRFVSVLDGGEEHILAAQKLSKPEDIAKHIVVGSKLEQVDGRDVEEVISELAKSSRGSNEDAMRMRAVQMLSFRSLHSQALPQKNEVQLKFEGQDKPITVPWLARIDSDCEQMGRRRERISDSFLIGEDKFQKQFNSVFGSPTLAPKMTDSFLVPEPLDEVFDADILKTAAGKVGYIKIKQFIWDDPSLDVETIVEGMRRLLEKDLASTAGLIIDVRGNPGGHIGLAEKLLQLFSATEVQPSTVHMLANDLNEKIFLKSNDGDNRWSMAIRDAISAHSRYTEPMTLTPLSDANLVGQVWFKPVVVLTDAACYSACDIFVAGMQDSVRSEEGGAAAAIVGLHRATGGGGANVMDYNTFARIFSEEQDNPFKSLPAFQSMRVAWRQSLRAGRHAGVLIEDKGVASDKVVRLSSGDIGAAPKELMRQIEEYMTGLTPKFNGGVEPKLGGLVLLPNNQAANWTEKVYGVDSLDLVVNGEIIATKELENSSTPKEIKIGLPSLKAQWKNQPVVIVGKRNGNSAFRVVRQLMWRGDYLPIPEKGLDLDFAKKPEILHTVLIKGAKDSGWQVEDKVLRIGAGPKYDNNVFAQAFLSLDLKGKGGTINVDASLKAESLNDTLRFYVVNPDTGERINYFAGSRIPVGSEAQIPLPTWQKADFVMEFESDENWNMRGPEIERIKILQKDNSDLKFFRHEGLSLTQSSR